MFVETIGFRALVFGLDPCKRPNSRMSVTKKEKNQLFNKVGDTCTSSKGTEMKSDGPESCVRLKLPLGPFKKNSSYYIYYI